MRKRTIKYGLDNIFWYIIYLLPIIMTVCILLGSYQGNWSTYFIENEIDSDNYPIMWVLDDILQYRFGFNGDSIIGQGLWALFGIDGILPFFNQLTEVYSIPIIHYFEYFVCVYLIHLVIDFILFIPRLAHKWLNYFTRTED